jgi:hypothetical protein
MGGAATAGCVGVPESRQCQRKTRGVDSGLSARLKGLSHRGSILGRHVLSGRSPGTANAPAIRSARCLATGASFLTYLWLLAAALWVAAVAMANGMQRWRHALRMRAAV